MVGPESFFTFFTIHQGIIKAGGMSGSFPHFGMEKNGSVYTHNITSLADKFFPPELFNIVFKFHTIGAVAIRISQTAVDFRGRKEKTPPFARRDDFLHL